jgi:uncharacterized Fe-S cluster-containing MiaB family protein
MIKSSFLSQLFKIVCLYHSDIKEEDMVVTTISVILMGVKKKTLAELLKNAK